ncbi:MAG: cytochrome c [Devosia sp.]|uniref:c-type cytochrome n=1 Tax=Devosia sp. TaxID=1871048 RepID=UPI001A0E8DB1|nr:cytochrome c [Devosia sp.]MBF0678823.1 cytochrome c [Devosia sp.]
MKRKLATVATLASLFIAGVSVAPTMAFQAAESTDAAVAEIDPAVMELGGTLYADNCAACHGENGDAERKFAGSQSLKHVVLIASQVIHGGEFMPKFDFLTDEEVAALGTYIRNSWGNTLGPVTAEEIAVYR